MPPLVASLVKMVEQVLGLTRMLVLATPLVLPLIPVLHMALPLAWLLFRVH